MERHFGSNPSGTEENEVLDVKPLRTLAPMFPTPLGLNTTTRSIVPPFVCSNPFSTSTSGSEACNSGFSPVFPTYASAEGRPPNSPPFAANGGTGAAKAPKSNGVIHATPLSAAYQTPTPISFRTPPTTGVSVNEGEDTLSDQKSTTGKRRGRPPKLGGSSGTNPRRKRLDKGVDIGLSLLPSSSHDPRESVEVVLMTFDALRRRLLQLDEAMDANKRADLKAGAIMMEKDLRANSGKRIGTVPGIEIGDIFYFRFEMCLVGLHAPSMAGIDYMTARFNDNEEPVAICIVSAGGYQNEEDDVDVLIYSGQGGAGKNDKAPDDQKLERGNLALERSLHMKNEIRVVRSAKDLSWPTGKIYIYDGLYKIEKSWMEKGKSGFNMFKYKLLREPGQPDGIAVWKMTQRWKENPSSRGRVILLDISSGVERIPVSLVNDVDSDKGPNHFTYITRIDYTTPIGSIKPLHGCGCLSVCLPGDKNCSCAQQNGGDLPYNSTGLLVSRKPLVYECNSFCQCSSNCRNRVTQKGVKLHFEVFKTANRGWGLRSWDPIRAGTCICEYTGEIIDRVSLDDDDADDEDEYIFKATYPGEKALKWNYGPELIGEAHINNPSETFSQFPFVISAKKSGNISRFMNHSCSPNVFWQPVQNDYGHHQFPHMMFFALKHIPPMTELTYDYGPGATESSFTSHTAKKCLCGSPNCRGAFG